MTRINKTPTKNQNDEGDRPLNSIISVLIGGGILAFIEFLITRHDKKRDKGKEVLDAIKTLDRKVSRLEGTLDERDAVLARTHILRFRDELYNNQKHTSEYFEQTLDDIKTYEQYCNTHLKFANGRTVAAAEFIQDEYKRLFKEHKL